MIFHASSVGFLTSCAQVKELEIPRQEAERALVAANGDTLKALQALVFAE